MSLREHPYCALANELDKHAADHFRCEPTKRLAVEIAIALALKRRFDPREITETIRKLDTLRDRLVNLRA